MVAEADCNAITEDRVGPKRFYEPPRLVYYGTLAELTQGVGLRPTDNDEGSETGS